jgi:hypothetical protein
MRDDQIFGLVASVALLIWLLGRRTLPNPLHRHAELLALGLVGAGILYALYRTALWATGP